MRTYYLFRLWPRGMSFIKAGVNKGCIQSFAEVRSKFPCIESLCDLVSIIKEEGESLEEFAMIAWLIWIRRNKQRLNGSALTLSKLAQSATALLDEFQ